MSRSAEVRSRGRPDPEYSGRRALGLARPAAGGRRAGAGRPGARLRPRPPRGGRSRAPRFPTTTLPGFPHAGVSGHRASLSIGDLEGRPRRRLRRARALLRKRQSRGDARPALEVLAALGAEALILTNAAGSLRPDMPTGSIMRLVDHINFSGLNPLIGEPSDARFVPMTRRLRPRARAPRSTPPPRPRPAWRSPAASMPGTPAPPSRRRPRSGRSAPSAPTRSACRRCPR